MRAKALLVAVALTCVEASYCPGGDLLNSYIDSGFDVSEYKAGETRCWILDCPTAFVDLHWANMNITAGSDFVTVYQIERGGPTTRSKLQQYTGDRSAEKFTVEHRPPIVVELSAGSDSGVGQGFSLSHRCSNRQTEPPQSVTPTVLSDQPAVSPAPTSATPSTVDVSSLAPTPEPSVQPSYCPGGDLLNSYIDSGFAVSEYKAGETRCWILDCPTAFVDLHWANMNITAGSDFVTVYQIERGGPTTRSKLQQYTGDRSAEKFTVEHRPPIVVELAAGSDSGVGQGFSLSHRCSNRETEPPQSVTPTVLSDQPAISPAPTSATPSTTPEPSVQPAYCPGGDLLNTYPDSGFDVSEYKAGETRCWMLDCPTVFVDLHWANMNITAGSDFVTVYQIERGGPTTRSKLQQYTGDRSAEKFTVEHRVPIVVELSAGSDSGVGQGFFLSHRCSNRETEPPQSVTPTVLSDQPAVSPAPTSATPSTVDVSSLAPTPEPSVQPSYCPGGDLLNSYIDSGFAVSEYKAGETRCWILDCPTAFVDLHWANMNITAGSDFVTVYQIERGGPTTRSKLQQYTGDRSAEKFTVEHRPPIVVELSAGSDSGVGQGFSLSHRCSNRQTEPPQSVTPTVLSDQPAVSPAPTSATPSTFNVSSLAPTTEPSVTNQPAETSVPTLSEKWCDTDSECRKHNDTEAMCVAGQCVCGQGFRNPQDTVTGKTAYVCVTESTRTDEVVRVSFDIACDAVDVSSVLRVVSDVVVQVVGGRFVSGTVFCGSVQVLVALTDVKLADAGFVEVLLNVNRQLGADAEAVQMGLTASDASLEVVDAACSSGQSGVASAVLIHDACVAVTCEEGYTPQDNACSADGDSSGLGVAAVVCISAGALMIVLVAVAFLVMKRRTTSPTQESQKEPDALELAVL